MTDRLHRPFLTLLVALLVSGLTVALAHGSGSAPHDAGHAHERVDSYDGDHDRDDHDHGHDHGHDDHGHDHGHDDHGHDHGPDDHGPDHGQLAGVRLLLASLDGPEILVIAAGDGHVLGRFTVPGVGRAYQLPTMQYAAVTHRDANRVSFVHSGLSAVDHGDHLDLLEGPPYVLKTVNLGPRPTHFFAQGHDIAVYADGDGSMAWLDARLLGISLDITQIPGAAPDHGSLAVIDGFLVGGGLREGGVGVFDRSERELARFDGCPGLHGQATLGMRVAFGCSDGVLLVEVGPGGEGFAAHKLDDPGDAPAGARVGMLVSHPGARHVIGDFGEGLALIDPSARSLTPVALPAAPAAMRFTDGGRALLVLTLDGVLHALDPDSGEHRASRQVVAASQQGQPRPMLEVYGDYAFVTDPANARVLLVDAEQLEVEGHHHLPFAPGSVAVMAIPGAVLH